MKLNENWCERVYEAAQRYARHHGFNYAMAAIRINDILGVRVVDIHEEIGVGAVHTVPAAVLLECYGKEVE